MAGLMQMPNGQMIVSLHTQHHPTPPDTRRRRVSHLSRTKCPALFLPPRSSVDRRRPSSLPPLLFNSNPRSCSCARARTRARARASSSPTSTHAWRSWTPSAQPWCVPDRAPTALKKKPRTAAWHTFLPPRSTPTHAHTISTHPPTGPARTGQARARRPRHHHHLQRRRHHHEAPRHRAPGCQIPGGHRKVARL